MNKRTAIFAAYLLAMLAALNGRPEYAAEHARPLSAQKQSTQTPAASPAADVHFDFGGNAAEIPAQFVENLVFLPVKINGSKALFFELDSSAPATSIDREHAAVLGLGPQSAAGAIANCVLSLPGVSISTAALPIDSKPAIAQGTGRPYEGTLGQDFFQRFVIEVDYARQTVRLYDPKTFKYSGAGKAFPVMFAGGIPSLGAKLAMAKGGTAEALFAVNTGLNASLAISEGLAQQRRLLRGQVPLKIDPELSASETLAIARLKSFALGPYDVENSIAEFPGVKRFPEGGKIMGEIGGGLLAKFIVVFDYPHQQIILDPNPQFGNEEQEDKSGISLTAGGPDLKRFEIVHVEPGTPASLAGLRAGDVIAGVDEDAAADLNLAELRDLFRQIGHKYKLLIERNGQTIPVTIEMRRLL